MNHNYVYIYLDTRKPGEWWYEGIKFDFQPFYLGKGTAKRMEFHLTEGGRAENNYKSRTINAIIRETGKNPEFFKIFSNLSVEKALEIEINMISYFGREGMDKGGILTNRTLGGEGGSKGIKISEETKEKRIRARTGKYSYNSKKIKQLNLDGELIRIWNSISDAVKGLKLKNGCGISNCCNGRQKTAHGFIFEFEGSSLYQKPELKPHILMRKVYQYTLSGVYIGFYNSIIEATRSMGRESGSSIWFCCNDRINIKSAYGFQWFFEYQGEKVPEYLAKDPNQKTKKSVICLDKNGQLIAEYLSLAEAARAVDRNYTNIAKACRTGNTCAGFYWKFKSSS